ncbi:MAG: Type IIS restriction enzyme Eco57I [Syntrophomonadaceae bacterium]|nr:Type IIS restriction enzyme Eco57I [Bacillota bacterium]
MTSSEDRKKSLSELISEYKKFKKTGKLDLTSEETIRSWLNKLLEIFDWDVRDTSQILQEKVLTKAEKEKLKGIGSHYIRPDYTFKIAKQKLSFLDAKDITININKDADAAFQIKSYGWSISAPCAFISNFEEFAIYDCTYIPVIEQAPDFGRIYLAIDDYIDQFEILEQHLLKKYIYSGKLSELYSDSLKNEKTVSKITPDFSFAEFLSEFRLALARSIFENNAEYIDDNAENLSYIVQIIINRILFVRVCEARKIEEDRLLLKFKSDGFWESFRNSSYFDFYDHYDGPLFERINSIHNIKIPDESFNSLLDYLYYPSPYKFDVIPTKLLSDIYEIFLSRKLIIQNGQVRDEFKSEYSKTKGAVSTPLFIVQEIVKRTIRKDFLLARGIESLLETKILDLSCGSGVFAIEVYDYLEDIFISLFVTSNHKDFVKYFIQTDTETIINLDGKKAILDNCIFGVDIDPEAVEVTKMSLSLKMIESTDFIESYNVIGIFGDKILSGIGNNIKCGNSLVSSDILKLYPKLEENEQELLRTNIFDWASNHGFERIFQEKEGFDFIVGNPPYVEVKNYNVDLPYMHKYIRGKYSSSQNGKIDLAVPFIERGISLLNPSGRLGFIVQKRFFKTDYGANIRKLITDDMLVSSIIDFEATNIFKDRITYVALLILDKSEPDNFYYKKFSDQVATLAASVRNTEIPEISDDPYLCIDSAAISENPWSFDDPDLLKIRTKLLDFGKLGDFVNVKVGVQVLWDKAYHIRPISVKNGKLTGSSHSEEKFKLELDACRPLICNENFYPYRPDNGDIYIIFPYDVQAGVVTEIEFSKFKERFPLAAEYLRRNKRKIKANVETFTSSERWHLFTRVQNHGATYPKVLTPMTALDTYATVSFSEEIYCDNANVYFMEIENKSANNLYALSAIINSTLFSVLARSIANPQSNGYYKFNKQFLEPIPFPAENFNSGLNGTINDMALTAKAIKRAQEKYLAASPRQQRTFATQLKKYWIRLDELVYDLYGLEATDKKFFRNRGRNINRVETLGNWK